MTSSAFIFPDPAVTPEFTATNGITYIYDSVDSKWIVKNSGINIQYIPTTGGTINADGGVQSSSGNLIIQQGSEDDQTGRLYLKGSDNVTNISMYSAGGGIDMKGNLSFNSTNSIKNIRAYGASSPILKFLTGASASTAVERMSISSSAVTVGTDLAVSGATAALNSQVTIEAPSDSSEPGLAIKTTNNTTTLWNATQPGHLQFETTAGNNGGTCGIQVQGESGNPSFTMTVGAPGYSLDRVFTYSYSSTYGKRVYIYPDWGQGYNNAVNLPDATPVTLGYLRNQGLITQAFTSVIPSNDPDDADDSITTQTSVSVGAQMQLDGRLTTGRGFSLSGCTIDQPVNTSAICLQLYHEITAPAQLLYKGDTTSENECVQTKASTEALITNKAVTPGIKEFQNKANNTGSTLQEYFLVEYIKNSDNIVQLMVSAKNNNNIVVGDVVCILPTAFRPASSDNAGNGYIPVFTLVNNGSNPTFTAQCVIKTDGSIVFINVGGNSANFYGQCVFTTHNPG